jgi:hypothetical protein
MPVLVTGIPFVAAKKDRRDKPGDDECRGVVMAG